MSNNDSDGCEDGQIVSPTNSNDMNFRLVQMNDISFKSYILLLFHNNQAFSFNLSIKVVLFNTCLNFFRGNV